jgi:hypothetical protein
VISLRKTIFWIVLILYISGSLYAQDHVSENHEVENKHRIALLYGLVYVPSGHREENHEDKGIFTASYGLEYSYRLNHKWALGFELNLEGGKYLIHGDLPRENALLITGMGFYEIMQHWEVYLGAGIEVEQHHNYGIIRVGTIYIFPIGKGWDLAPSFTFNHKSVYNSWEIAINVGKSF